ncbi:SDR family NAD(P)-dependent oxidoreductase [Devosia sp. A449]
MSDEFKGKVILITGAANGQGEAEVRRLVAAGATVIITDIDEAKGQALADDLGPNAVFQKLDVAEEVSWTEAMAVCRHYGRLDGLVNNAGIFVPAMLEDTTPDLVLQHFRVNQLGVVLGMKMAAPVMRESGGGSIVNVSSVAGLKGVPDAIAYCGTKWAVRGMTRSAASALAVDKIRVNSLYPGYIDTDMLSIPERSDLDARLNRLPMKRIGTPDEVADACVFLLSNASTYMTGAEICIDGGLIL